MQYHTTEYPHEDLDHLGAEPLTGSGFDHELPESGFDADIGVDPEPGEEEHQ